MSWKVFNFFLPGFCSSLSCKEYFGGLIFSISACLEVLHLTLVPAALEPSLVLLLSRAAAGISRLESVCSGHSQAVGIKGVDFVCTGHPKKQLSRWLSSSAGAQYA